MPAWQISVFKIVPAAINTRTLNTHIRCHHVKASSRDRTGLSLQALLSVVVSSTVVIHSRSSSVDTVMVSEEMMLLVLSRPRKHICRHTAGSSQTHTHTGQPSSLSRLADTAPGRTYNAARLTCVLSRSHLSPVLLAVAGRARGTRPQVGPSALAGWMRAVPALSRRTRLPSPHSAMFRWR